jgi:hypothetical protein
MVFTHSHGSNESSGFWQGQRQCSIFVNFIKVVHPHPRFMAIEGLVLGRRAGLDERELVVGVYVGLESASDLDLVQQMSLSFSQFSH